MSVRKTRIKIETLKDETYRYIPQHRGWFGWYDFRDQDAYSILTHTNPYTYRPTSTCLIAAQQSILDYINAYNKNEEILNKKKGKVVKTEYVKFP